MTRSSMPVQVEDALGVLLLAVVFACDGAKPDVSRADFSTCWHVKNWVECDVGNTTVQCGSGVERLSGKTYLSCTDKEALGLWGVPKLGWDLPTVGCRVEHQTAVLLSDAFGGKLLTAKADVQRAFLPRSEQEAMALLKLTNHISLDHRNKVFAQSERCGCDPSVSLVRYKIDRDGTINEIGRQATHERLSHSCD